LLAFIAAEAREFAGILRSADRVSKVNWPIDFARFAWWNGEQAILAANGPGPKLAGEAVEVVRKHQELTGLVSTGYCGALDPALRPCDVFVAKDLLVLPNSNSFVGQAILPAAGIPAGLGQAGSKGCRQDCLPYGRLLSIDRVACTASEKSELRKTGAAAVEMEAAGVAQKAVEYNLPFYCIRVVTDTADEDLPLDFNRMRGDDGRFSRARIVAAAFRRPIVFRELIQLNKRCNDASQALGDFIAGTRF
jgi:adenosylhomocysteine nucleosidase